MFMMVKGLVVAVSVAGVIGGANAQSQPKGDSPVPTYAASVHHGPGITAVSSSRGSIGARAGVIVPKAGSETTCMSVNGDGVRVRSTWSTAGAVLGLAYRGDRFQVHDEFSSPDMKWAEGTDFRNGVHGWVAFEFLNQDWGPC